MSENFIKQEENNGVVTITINREDVYNALNKDSKKLIVKAIKSANKNSELRAIVLTGSGTKAFCSGQDLNDRSIDTKLGPVNLGETLNNEWNPLIKAIRNSSLPVIAAVNGVCAGAGLSIAVACDLVVAVPTAKFVSGFSKLAIANDAGSGQIFARAMGPKKALEFFYFNQPLLASDMCEYGLINSVADNALETAQELASQIAALAPYSVTAIKQNVQLALETSFTESLERETKLQRFLGHTKDYQEGLLAFKEKRSPQFKGE
jgi:2-(1,2-epoxy-1,2-dihydrophenyl)acetyl-CoA isomerase